MIEVHNKLESMLRGSHQSQLFDLKISEAVGLLLHVRIPLDGFFSRNPAIHRLMVGEYPMYLK